MHNHIFAHQATAKYFSNSFVFKNEIEKEGLPRDSTPALGAGGPRFKSGRPDQNYLAYFLSSTINVLHPKIQCGIPAGRSARSQIIGQGQARDGRFAGMGKIRETLRISS